MDPRIIDTKPKYEGRFLRFDLIIYEDSHGAAHRWEAVQRQNDATAVTVIALLKPSDRVVLVKQFRPPVGAMCIEFPAGLVDEGESPAQAALRELREETGYVGEVVSQGVPCVASAGMSGESGTLVAVSVDETLPENANPVQHLDDNEDIQVLKIRRDELLRYLRWNSGAGLAIGGTLYAWALGDSKEA